MSGHISKRHNIFGLFQQFKTISIVLPCKRQIFQSYCQMLCRDHLENQQPEKISHQYLKEENGRPQWPSGLS